MKNIQIRNYTKEINIRRCCFLETAAIFGPVEDNKTEDRRPQPRTGRPRTS